MVTWWLDTFFFLMFCVTTQRSKVSRLSPTIFESVRRRGVPTPVEMTGGNKCRRAYLIVVVRVPSLFVLELNPAYLAR